MHRHQATLPRPNTGTADTGMDLPAHYLSGTAVLLGIWLRTADGVASLYADGPDSAAHRLANGVLPAVGVLRGATPSAPARKWACQGPGGSSGKTASATNPPNTVHSSASWPPPKHKRLDNGLLTPRPFGPRPWDTTTTCTNGPPAYDAAEYARLTAVPAAHFASTEGVEMDTPAALPQRQLRSPPSGS